MTRSGSTTQPRHDAPPHARPVTAHGWGRATFAFLLLAGLVTKLSIAAVVAVGERTPVSLLYAPTMIGGELVLAASVGAVATIAPAVIAAGLYVVSVVLGLWMTANVLSYAIDQTPLTWWRLRGGEGGGVGDLGLIEVHDWAPVVALALVLVVVAIGLARAARRTPGRGNTRALVAAFVVGALLMVLDDRWACRVNRGLGEQSVFVFARSCVDDERAPLQQREGTAQEWAELSRSHTGAPTREALPRIARPARNAILFFAEGIARDSTTLGDGAMDTMPLLAARAATSGVELTDHHAPFHKSIAALFSMACSDWPPPDGVNITEINPRIDCGELSEELDDGGIRAGYFHGGPFGFYDKLAFFGGRSWDVLVDSATLNDGRWFTHRWGVDDRATVQATLDWIDELDGERFFALVVPIAAHYPYDVPPDLRHGDATAPRSKFLDDVRFVDVVFDTLMQGLQERGIADDTLVAFIADHGDAFPPGPHRTRGVRLAYESNLHVPAVLFGGPLIGPMTSSRATSHLDLMPTFLDALGLPADPRHRGTSLFRESPGARIFIGALNGRDEYTGFLDGDRKVLLDVRNDRLEVYDVAHDPLEQDDLSSTIPADEARALRDDARRFYAFQGAHLQAAASKGDDVSVPDAVFDHARFDVAVGRDVKHCTLRQAHEGACDGIDASVVPGRGLARVDGLERDCLLLTPPPHATTTITVDDRSVLPFISQAMLGRVQDTNEERGSYKLVARGDGVSSTSADATKGRRGSLGADKAFARVSSPPADEMLELVITTNDDGGATLCLALDDRSWRARSAE